MTCPHTSTLGVYLLGALEPEERSAFESHLYGCDICRAELVRLAPLPGLLNQISVTDFEEITEPPAPAVDPVRPAELPEPVVLDAPPSEPDPVVRKLPTPRTRRAWQITGAAAAAVVLLVAGFFGYQAVWGSDSPERSVTWSADDPNSGVHAQIQLTERSWGTDIKVWMSDVPGSKECRLVVMAKNGYRDRVDPYYEIAGWWTSGHSAHDDIPGSTSIDLASIRRLEIMDGDTMLVGLNSQG
jgi:hypothetical protein